MSTRQKVLLMAVVGTTLVTPVPLRAQGHGPPGGMAGMQRGMMGGARDSATMALMSGSHQLVMNHARITRTVTDLPNGIRAVTESDDARVAALIREHVATTSARVARRDDPALPIESPALRTIFRYGDRIRTTTTATERGIVVEQTSSDSVAVAALQAHAREVSELVDEGMAALHRARMSGGAPGASPPSGMVRKPRGGSSR